ncbi:mechanosensitive ion channel [Luteimonas soli]|uniref:Small-conductance mechanosensitive channel n=1 Tax=Luteimonas soli TaxID=1648966 RepID=A0ABV7XKS8_9GAMM
MHFDTWYMPLQASLGTYLPTILGALAVLLIGWIVALVAASLTRKGLAKLRANERLATQTKSGTDFQRLGGRIVFWIIFLVALVGALGILRIDGVTGPLSGLLDTLVPAIVLGVVAWLVATVVRVVVHKVLGATSLDEKLVDADRPKRPPLSRTMGDVAYWLVLLLFLPAIVGTLHIDALTAPLSNMISGMLGMLPNLIAAAVIGVVGWIIARVVREVVTNLLVATNVDRFTQENEETRGIRLSQLGGTLVFILVIVPTIIAALDALRIEAISGPLTGMLDEFLLAVPNIIAAAVILLLAWFIGRFVAQLVARLLSNLGFDRVPERVGLGHAFAAQAPAPTVGTLGDPDAPAGVGTSPSVGAPGLTLSELVGKIALFFIMLFATVEAAAMLGFAGVHELLEMFIAFGADILLGLVIFVVGYWLADLAARAIERANPEGRGMARIARVAILGLVVAMGLRAMGVADDIVNLAFGLVLGAVAVAIALAFGLGGRDAAGKVAQRWADAYLSRQRTRDGE